MTSIDQSSAASASSKRCTQCGRFMPSSAGDLCERCSPPERQAPEELGEVWIQPDPTDAERAALLRRAKEDFVVARPSQLHSGSVVSPGLRVPAPAPRDPAPSASCRGGPNGVRPRRSARSPIRTALISMVLILAGITLAAALPLLLSLLGS